MPLGGLGAMEIALIMLVLMLVFGAKRLPELGRGLGQGIREFKDTVSGIGREPTALPGEGAARPRLEASGAEESAEGTTSG
ncbi:MAG: Sec-independent protein translocase subunit TatA/TatB [Gemmatimonadota bacterium]